MYATYEAFALAMAKDRVANAIHAHDAVAEWCRLECRAGKHDG